MSGAKAFLDTNVLLYLASPAESKADIAERVVMKGGSISVQVLNEFISVARKKMLLPWAAIAEFTNSVRSTCEVVPLTLAIHDLAVHIAKRYRVPIYDATILAAALSAGCSVLLTEDFQHGQIFEKCLRVCNPLAGN